MKDIREIIGDCDKNGGITISSTNSYFELISVCANKLELEIPETIIVKDNEARDWIYTKKENPRRDHSEERRKNKFTTYVSKIHWNQVRRI